MGGAGRCMGGAGEDARTYAESEISTELTITCKKEKHFVYRRTHGYRDTQKTSTCKTRLCVTPYKLHLNREGKKKINPMGSMSFCTAYYVNLLAPEFHI